MKYKFLWKFILIFLANNSCCIEDILSHYSSTNTSVQALSAIITQFFSIKSCKISFIICENENMLSDLLKELDLSVIYNIENCKNMSVTIIRSSAVFFIDEDGAQIINDMMNTNLYRFDTSGYFLLYTSFHSKQNEDLLTKTFNDLFIINMNILTRQNRSFVLKTFFPFSETSCNSLSNSIINKFENDSFESSLFYPEKTKNYQKCPLKIVTFIYAPIIMVENHGSPSNFTLYGADISLINVFAETLNFTIEYDFDPEPGAWGMLTENGTASHGFLKIKTKKADMMIGGVSKIYFRTKYISFTDTIVFSPIVLLIPPGAPFSAFEKLFSPFEKDVWIYLLVTFLFGISFVMFIKLKANSLLKEIIIGENIQMPVMSIFVAIVGGSQHVLPTKSTARILLISL